MGRILNFEAVNFRKIDAVKLDLRGKRVLIVGGPNGAGKSSLGQAFRALFGGGKVKQHLKNGAGNGHVAAEIERDGRVETWRLDVARGELEIKTDVGATMPSAREMANQLLGDGKAMMLDPVAFANMKPDDAAEVLAQIAGVDTTAIDAAFKEAFESRTAAKRHAETLYSTATSMPHFPDAPKDESALLNTASLAAKLTAEGERRRDLDVLARKADNAKWVYEQADQRVVDLMAQLSAAQDAQVEAYALLSAADREVAKFNEAYPPVCDPVEVQTQIHGAEDWNKQIRANIARNEFSEKFNEANAEVTALEARVEELRQEKRRMLQEAKYPVEGLSLNEDRKPTYKGVPLSEVSSGERVRIGFELALSQCKGELKPVLIDGTPLDAANLEAVIQMVEATEDVFAFIERVDDDPRAGIILRAGQVAVDRLQEAAA